MRRVFVDTVGLLAIWNNSDQWYPAASSVYKSLAEQRVRIVTTPFVLMECGNAAARSVIRSTVDDYRIALEEERMLVAPTDYDWRMAWGAYRRGEAEQAGIVDQISFAVMRRLGITDAFTNDKHFRAAGFNVLF